MDKHRKHFATLSEFHWSWFLNSCLENNQQVVCCFSCTYVVWLFLNAALIMVHGKGLMLFQRKQWHPGSSFCCYWELVKKVWLFNKKERKNISLLAAPVNNSSFFFHEYVNSIYFAYSFTLIFYTLIIVDWCNSLIAV